VPARNRHNSTVSQLLTDLYKQEEKINVILWLEGASAFLSTTGKRAFVIDITGQYSVFKVPSGRIGLFQ